MKSVKIMLFWLMLFVIIGCAAAPPAGPPSEATLHTRTLKPSPGKALVYYYNHKLFLGSTSIKLDEMSSKIDPNTYVVWEIAPGTHYLEFKYQGLLPEYVKFNIQCAADQTYYFYMLGDSRETHEIAQDTAENGRATIERFSLAAWFKDGALVPEDTTRDTNLETSNE